MQRVGGLARFRRSVWNPASWPLTPVLLLAGLGLGLLTHPGSGCLLIYSQGQLRPTHQHPQYFLGSRWCQAGQDRRREIREKQTCMTGGHSITGNTQLSCVSPPAFSHCIFTPNCYHLAGLCWQVGRGRVLNLTSGQRHVGKVSALVERGVPGEALPRAQPGGASS